MTSGPALLRVRLLRRIFARFGMLIGLALAGLLPATAVFAAPPLAGELVKASLYAESATVAAGQTLWVDVHLAVAPGWHVYWKNPGDSGLPTEINWTLPSGFSAGPIAWPMPERFQLGPIANYGYAGDVDLLVPISVPSTFGADAMHIGATVKYLVCAEICIPGEAK